MKFVHFCQVLCGFWSSNQVLLDQNALREKLSPHPVFMHKGFREAMQMMPDDRNYLAVPFNEFPVIQVFALETLCWIPTKYHRFQKKRKTAAAKSGFLTLIYQN